LKELVITRHGGPEVLQVRERPTPEPGPGEVRLKVSRAGLTFADVSARVGLYPDAPPPPCVVGYEVCGTVEARGPDVQSPELGTRVLSLTRFGGHASHIVVPARFVVPVVPQLTDDEAAGLPVNYLTAFHMLFYVHHLKPGAHVFFHRAAGGVGLALLQLARTVPGVVLYGTASAGKHEALRKLGFDHPIDYKTHDYADEVKRLTNGRGVDLVMDSEGGPDWKKGYGLLRPAGHLIAFGWGNMVPGEKRSLVRVASQFVQQPLFSGMGLMNDNKTVSGVNLGHLWKEEELLRGHLEKLMELARAGRVKPPIDSVFPLSKGADAHRQMQSRKNVGKVVLDCTA
jgi:synaptic vesicle membrane protein VAT-1